MTEAEAKTKLCPILLNSRLVWIMKDGPSEFEDDGRCKGAGCMMWRVISGGSVINNYPPTGYCGLAGKP